MGNLGLSELVLMIPFCLVGIAGIAGPILGIVAFLKVRKLEERIEILEKK